MTHNRVLAAEC